MKSRFCPVRFRNIHIEESKKPGFTFSIKLRIHSKHFRVISSSIVATLGTNYIEQAAQAKRQPVWWDGPEK